MDISDFDKETITSLVNVSVSTSIDSRCIAIDIDTHFLYVWTIGCWHWQWRMLISISSHSNPDVGEEYSTFHVDNRLMSMLLTLNFWVHPTHFSACADVSLCMNVDEKEGQGESSLRQLFRIPGHVNYLSLKYPTMHIIIIVNSTTQRGIRLRHSLLVLFITGHEQ